MQRSETHFRKRLLTIQKPDASQTRPVGSASFWMRKEWGSLALKMLRSAAVLFTRS
jgi:hypothetical protein